MNAWLIAATALVPGLLACGWIGSRAATMDRLVALELAGSLMPLVVVLLAEGYARPSLYDLALTLAVLSLPGTIVFAHFLERWL
ncbi:MAG TPA: monovalent cation/H+ antiporter complex subunit F [Pirellulales bacterium]|jgi:multicomponent Na+:H+ antiporter subunit F|nr:monovalent cation/H+ antiporter complex subunit F [Pirellulales bacterium]